MSDFNLARETPPLIRQGETVNSCFNFYKVVLQHLHLPL